MSLGDWEDIIVPLRRWRRAVGTRQLEFEAKHYCWMLLHEGQRTKKQLSDRDAVFWALCFDRENKNPEKLRGLTQMMSDVVRHKIGSSLSLDVYSDILQELGDPLGLWLAFCNHGPIDQICVEDVVAELEQVTRATDVSIRLEHLNRLQDNPSDASWFADRVAANLAAAGHATEGAFVWWVDDLEWQDVGLGIRDGFAQVGLCSKPRYPNDPGRTWHVNLQRTNEDLYVVDLSGLMSLNRP